MGMKRLYSCNICRDELKNPVESYGLHFKNMTEFTLGGYGCTEGVHICFRCARQLAARLNHEIIKKELGI